MSETFSALLQRLHELDPELVEPTSYTTTHCDTSEGNRIYYFSAGSDRTKRYACLSGGGVGDMAIAAHCLLEAIQHARLLIKIESDIKGRWFVSLCSAATFPALHQGNGDPGESLAIALMRCYCNFLEEMREEVLAEQEEAIADAYAA